MSTRFPTLKDTETPREDPELPKALKRANNSINTVLRECERLQAENAKLRERYDGLIKAHNKLVDDLKAAKRGR